MKESRIHMEDNDSTTSTTDRFFPGQGNITPQTSGTSTPNTLENSGQNYQQQFDHNVLDDDYFTETHLKAKSQDQDGTNDGIHDKTTGSCFILPQRDAVLMDDRTMIKLSALAAATLIGDGILSPRDLSLYPSCSQTPPPGPTDPISGIISATHRTIGGVVMGVADYPIEIMKMVKADREVAAGLATDFALDSGKGISRIVGTGLKAPMDMTLNISRGFGNVPKLYGDETVREEEKITGVVSGLGAAGKGFGFGLYDGITGLVTQPISGAKKGGLGGFFAGVGKGLGGVVCKPAAGAVGLAAYPFKGIYEEVKNKRDDHLRATLLADGKRESLQWGEEQRSTIVSRWYTLSQYATIGEKSKYQ
ncbi:hypothetical protein VTL71DRAFT_6179 [Oculimacula yallundae]|uniref:Uncharacterized protein n=1 Tax=Oculimacula yallundae TaxID=86028 RepID=A0ABR4C0K2_9HELO